MKYYLHDSNSFNDEKITQLFINFGYEGLGLFYTILEKLSQQEKPILTDVLKHQLKVGKKLDKCWKFMEEIELISSNNSETFNEQLLNFSKKYQIKKEKNTERIKQWRDNQRDAKNVTRYENVSNITKVNKSKVNKSKVEVVVTSATQLKKILDELPKEKIEQMKEFTLFRGNLEEIKQKFCVEFISRYGLNKTKIEAIEAFQSWMHRDKNIPKNQTNNNKKDVNSKWISQAT